MNSETSARLRNAIGNCNPEECKPILDSIDLNKKHAAGVLHHIHEALLFAVAYAPAREIEQQAGALLKQLTCTADESGIRGGTVISAYTYRLTKWMAEICPDQIHFHSFDDEKSDVGELLKIILPTGEAEILSNGYSKNKLFKHLCGGKITLEKILGLFANSTNEKLNEQIFSQLKVYIEINFTDNIICRSTSRSVEYPSFYCTEILRKPDVEKIISTKLPKQNKLSHREKISLASNARMQLAAMGRETDPVTFSADEETEFFVLDRGLSIALFSIQPEFRLGFDSYIGYMMFRNGLPIAYGGAWIFFHRALIGINIFDAYRGGESAFLFAQLLRVYHQRYGVKRFSVEPYQYGKDNPEGIASGAYWFYYRFGFRSDDMKLSVLAEKENEKIKTEKGYRTSTEVLKEFTKSNITFILDASDKSPDPAALSLGISAMIAKDYEGNRKKALQAADKNFQKICRRKFPVKNNKQRKQVYENWSLALLFYKITMMSAGNVNHLIKAMEMKAQGSEAAYIVSLQKTEKEFSR